MLESRVMYFHSLMCSTESDISKHSSEFYSCLPHSKENAQSNPIISMKVISQKQDLCQLVRDMVAVSEATNWSMQSGPVAKYRSLRCHIDSLDPQSEEFLDVEKHMLETADQ